MGKLINIGSIMGKNILDVTEGSMIGKVSGVALAQDNKVAGLKVKQKKFMGTAMLVPFENVKAFGPTITLTGVDGSVYTELREAIGKDVITADGNLLGRVEEFAFDSETGVVEEVVIKGDLVENMIGGRGILSGDKILTFGKDVVVADENLSAGDFRVPEEDFYGDWKMMDEMLDEIADEENEYMDGLDADDDLSKDKARQGVEGTIDGITKTVGETFNKLKDEVTSDRFQEQTDRFIDRFSEEAKSLFNILRLRVKNFDMDEFKEDLKNRMNHREEPEDILAADLASQLNDLTVEKPVLDEEGNVIVWPGQIIGKEEIKVALRSGKLQDLLDLANVSLLNNPAPANPAQAEDAAEETVEEDPITEDDAAFIAEEAAKMEEAEEQKEEAAAEETATEETVVQDEKKTEEK